MGDPNEHSSLAHERRLLRAAKSDPDQFFEAATTTTFESNPMDVAIAAYTRRIPKTKLLSWLANTRSMMDGLTNPSSQSVSIGDACIGSNIWVHCLSKLFGFWSSEFGTENVFLEHYISAEIHPAKQQFICQQFEPAMLVADVVELSHPRGWDLQSGKPQLIKWPQLFGSGFSCKAKSNQNVNRTRNKACIQMKETSTGHRVDGC